MSRRRNTRKSEYRDIDPATYDTADGIDPEQFTEPKRKFPFKTLIFILTFIIVGSACIAVSILISSGYYDAKYQSRIWPLLIIGILMFIPGGYYGYILICILLKRDGFTFDDIPAS